MGNGYYMHGDMGWGWIFALIAIIGIAGIVLLVLLLARQAGGGTRGGPSPIPGEHVNKSASSTGRSHARQILAERYARGEIDTADYQERLQHLPDE